MPYNTLSPLSQFLPDQQLAPGPQTPQLQPMSPQPPGQPPMPSPVPTVDPDIIQRLAALWGVAPEEARLKLEQEQANALMGYQGKAGYQMGNMFVASPGDAIATGLARTVGGIKDIQNKSDRQKLMEKQQQGNEAMMSLYFPFLAQKPPFMP